MFERIADLFKGGVGSLTVDGSGKPTERDVIVATGVLLLEVAGADSDYAPEETKAVFQLMQSQFGLNEEDVLSLLEVGDSLRQHPEKVDEFIDTVSSSFDAKQKERIFGMLWRVIIADGRVDKFEQRFATQIRFRLKLTDDQYERAKKFAEDGRI